MSARLHPACLPACPFLAAEEIYVVSIGAFAGRGFSDLVRELFEQHGVILLGISEDRSVVLHPGAGYLITEVNTVAPGLLDASAISITGQPVVGRLVANSARSYIVHQRLYVDSPAIGSTTTEETSSIFLATLKSSLATTSSSLPSKEGDTCGQNRVT